MSQLPYAQPLFATLRAALHAIDVQLDRARDHVEEIAVQAEHMYEALDELRALRRRQDAYPTLAAFAATAREMTTLFRMLTVEVEEAQAYVDARETAMEVQDEWKRRRMRRRRAPKVKGRADTAPAVQR